MTDKELLQMALNTLDLVTDLTNYDDEVYETIEAIKARLAQPEPKVTEDMWEKLSELQQKVMEIAHTAPQKKEWVGLTDEEYEAMAEDHVTDCYFDTLEYAKAIEAKLKEKNT